MVWLEKEQLFDVSVSIGRALELLGETVDPNIGEDENLGSDDPSDDWTDDNIEFKAWSIRMNYDDNRKVFEFEASGPSPDTDTTDPAEAEVENNVTFFFSLIQAKELTERGIEIVYAGRPLCVHCERPINAGDSHVCDRRNGHKADEARGVIDAVEGR